MRRTALLCVFAILSGSLLSDCVAQPIENRKYQQEDKFRQLEEILPTPNSYRTASGAPGPGYWQQQANYVIDIRLDDANQHLYGSEKISYKNNSPHPLNYIWLQLDANIFSPDSDYNRMRTFSPSERMSTESLEHMQLRATFDGGCKITGVTDRAGKDLAYTIVKTMMRIDLPTKLQPGEQFEFNVEWNYQINDSDIVRGRTGAEFFEKDKNYIYEIAQWFPRLVAFTDANGWQHKQFLGQGEFTLELGDYLVRITVPDDHIVAATGVLQNPSEVLSTAQQERFEQARTAKRPVFIVTPEEAAENQKEGSDGEKTWVFHAQSVRDFAWSSSRKFIWDAQGHDIHGNPVMAMSFYPNEAEPLWSKYSTHSIIHTLNVYSRYTFAFPYPTAISVNGPVYGMEYPMICFNGPRPNEDGTYSDRTKYGLISVVIHEVGHNFFPMIVNTDERQWTWMDEGINTFLQYLAEQEWEDNYPSRRGEPSEIVSYMLSNNQVPIMTNSESILQFGNNAYAKPATALNILRETILGRELFDFAFQQYAQRWQFKRPMPADFFRTMEDASGVDLDWFWRGWFYSTEHCDIAIDKVRWAIPTDGDPDAEADRKRKERDSATETLSEERNKELTKRVDEFPELKDFYNSYDALDVTPESRAAYARSIEKLTPAERELLKTQTNFYTVTLKNLGGLVMPVILQATFEDGSQQILRAPAEIWNQNSQSASLSFTSEKVLSSIELDPRLETADTNRDNNYFPPRLEPSRFQIYKSQGGRGEGFDNPMRAARRRAEEAEKKAKAEAEKSNPNKADSKSDPAAGQTDDANSDTERSSEATLTAQETPTTASNARTPSRSQKQAAASVNDAPATSEPVTSHQEKTIPKSKERKKSKNKGRKDKKTAAGEASP